MTSRTALFALLAAWGVATFPSAAPAEDGEAPPLLVDRVWQRVGSELPGVIRIFLSDGTLVQDSCWETHRLSPWAMTSGTALSWNEDGMDIPADIVSLTDAELVLRLHLVGGAAEEQRYAPAEVPFLCPDMPR